MKTLILVLAIVFANSIVILSAFISKYLSKKKEALKESGFSENDIELLQDIKKMELPEIFIFFAAQLFCGILVYLIFEGISLIIYIKYILIPSCIIHSLFHFLFIKKENIRFKEHAVKTNSDIIIDFNLKLLKSLHRFYPEIMLHLVLLLYAVLVLNEIFGTILIISLIWIHYFYIKRKINRTFHFFRINYLLYGGINIFLHFLLVFSLIAGTFKIRSALSTAESVCYFVLLAGLVVKLIYTGFKFFELYKKLNLKDHNKLKTVNG